ncbi:hypothetical protein ELUMI_v1c06320 [Williamsoniiplasma luminosum]|uniref:Uncharacterized protein n=1 Tax=Williamsoniiplasma luminosum TaxID=214888 RepID=A0A2K8NUA8_9MOLU|nr:hypothetical protein [Williamsoniiplasma luminosum]ATZ17354.1 hypothetical protein ELUMI_v1c06320 [Williamsoniiplasma luminosum]
MIEFLKLAEIKPQDINNLRHISPWWNKMINKQIKKLQKIMLNFKTNPLDFWKQERFEVDDYELMFRSINNYLNFYNQKISHILTSKKAFKKFEKWIATYANTLGFASGIYFMMQYFNHLENNEVEDKKAFAIELSKKRLDDVYDRYKREIKKILHHDDELAQIYKFEMVEFKTEKNIYIDYQLIFKTIVKFITNLNLQKKLDDNVFLKVLYHTIIVANFIHAYVYFSTNLIKRII